ncbi:MAG: arsenate reductase family protein [Oscillospiraceae bacterium]|nr:arsenate reductase family protein [Oscillospiraceae bacterium]
MLFIEYPPCTTCKKAKKWLQDHGLSFTARHIKEENPTAGELDAWQAKSGLELKRFFNTSGMRYRELELKDKLPAMSREEQLRLLSSDGMLVKRPILVTEDTVLVGFREKDWEKLLQK